MAFDEVLAVRVYRVLIRKRGIEEKKMFGGKAFMLNGNLLVGVRKDSLLLRLGPEEGERALSADFVREFVIKGRGPMKGWVIVDPEGFQSDENLEQWIQRAIKFVAKLPAKS